MVYGLYALSPVNHPVCHRHRRDAASHRRQLGAKALGRQNHTTSPSANLATRRANDSVSRHPPPHPDGDVFKRRSSCTPVDRSRPSRPATPCAHDALASTASPAQRVVTFARRPSWRAGMGQADHIFRNFEIKIFFSVGLDRPNQPERTAEFRFFAHAVVTGSSAARPGQARSFCPTGESPGLPGMGFAGRYEPTADLLWI